jgi:HupE / UreJ protein
MLFYITNMMKQFKRILLILIICYFGATEKVFSHPMPNSIVSLNIHQKHISGEIQLPLNELQSAIGMGVNDNSKRLIERLGDSIRIYLKQHIRPKTFDGKPWQIVIGEMKVIETKSKLTGDYKELIVDFSMTPPAFDDLRNFYFDYDVILHKVSSHSILVNVKQDWQQGIISEDSAMQQIGVIALDIPSGKIPIFQVSLQQGSVWKGFKSMFYLGIQHIQEGTDHLLFLLVLLLPIPLIASNKKWGNHRDVKTSIIHIIKVVTAFTIGHSLTLIFGAFGWLILPTQWIEILIGISILVSAIHAIRPLFPNKETYIALGFGLIHGLAFANTLTNLQLDTPRMVLSILGFNIGIELMQLLIISVTIPWLILMSRTSFYQFFRVIGAIIGIFAACGWILERIQNKVNFATILIGKFTSHSLLLLLGLIILAVFGYFMDKRIGVNKRHN